MESGQLLLFALTLGAYFAVIASSNADPTARATSATIPPQPAPNPNTAVSARASTTDSVACDFSNGLCGWSQYKDDNFDWLRHTGGTPTNFTGPSGDHTTGSGYYIYIEASQHRFNERALLLSPSLHLSTPSCFSFWYNMYGPHVNTLNFYLTNNNSFPGSLVWTLMGTQGPNWHYGHFTVPADTKQIVVEALRGVFVQGDIALDDFNLLNSPCSQGQGSTVSGLSCDFENNRCGYTSDNEDFNWTRIAGHSGQYGTGPSMDHTYGSARGHYMYTNASAPLTAGQKAGLISPQTTKGPHCLTFWYHMHGTAIGTLNVYTRINNNRGTPVWTMASSQGNRWRVAQFTLIPALDWQLEFEGVLGRYIHSDVAIDDVNVTTGACAARGACSFDGGNLCGFINSRSSGDNFDWMLRKRGTPTKGTGPMTDHSTNSLNGYYVFIESSRPQQQGNKAWLVSESLPATGSSPHCVSFWYHMYGPGVGSLSVYLSTAGTLPGTAKWQLAGNQGNAWKQGRFTLTSPNLFMLVFEGVVGVGHLGDIALDDIMYTPGSCRFNPFTAEPTSFHIRNADCTFDMNNTCTWIQSHNDNFDWSVTSLQTPNPSTGPSFGHSRTGSYLYLNSSSPRHVGDVADLISPTLTTSLQDKICFSFWFHMYGPSIGNLSVITDAQGTQVTHWTRSGTQGDGWFRVLLTLSGSASYKLILRGVVGGSQGDIAVDDITFVDGLCPNTDAKLCNFEHDLCSYTQETDTDTMDWVRSAASNFPDLPFDHTYGSRTGHYLAVRGSGQANSSAVIYSPTYAASGGECLQFYNSIGAQGSLLVHLNSPTGARIRTLWHAGAQNNWNQAQVTISSTKPYEIAFEARPGSATHGVIALDDISIHPFPCSPPGSCHFETGMCSYRNLHGSDQFDWTLGFGNSPSAFRGPDTDHTTSTAQGHYVFSESHRNNIGAKAQLESEKLPETSGSCLVFYYNMNGQGLATLNVYVKLNTSPFLHFNRTGRHDQQWIEANVDFHAPIPYRLVFEAVKGDSSDSNIAIDDISLSEGSCNKMSTGLPPATTTHMPTIEDTLSCSFEAGLCHYTQDKNDDFDWIRTRGVVIPDSTGPLYDRNSWSGYYMYLNSTSSPPNYLARLHSSTFSVKSAKCVSFYYHMYGRAVSRLELSLVWPGTATSLLWTRYGSQSFRWIQVFVDLTQFSNAQLMFEGYAGHSGSIAIDDIVVYDGSCPREADSSECDFEDGLCDFLQSTQDDFDWTLNQRNTNSTNTGPTNDHTYGTSQGHYIYIESSTPNGMGDKARLYSPALDATQGSCLTFWYNMNGRDVGTLNVYTVYVGTAPGIPTWSLGNDQGPGWKMAVVDVISRLRFQVVFEGIVGGGYHGDIAIDDVSVSHRPCLGLADCDFENSDSCGWTENQDDDLDWLLNSASATGGHPRNDHTIGNAFGELIFIDSGTSARAGLRAVITSQVIPINRQIQDYCFTFWYHMYGSTIGKLNVTYNFLGQASRSGFLKNGSQGNQWVQGFLAIPSPSRRFVITAEATVGGTYTGIIALDDFKLNPSSCADLNRTATSNQIFLCKDAANTTIPQSKVCNFMRDCPSPFRDEANCGNCNFETDLCQWKEESGGIYRWSRGSSSEQHTNITHTPPADHFGSASGSFIYVSQAVGTWGFTARLVSLQFGHSSATCQMHFWYYRNIAARSLSVYISEEEEQTFAWMIPKGDSDYNDWKQAVANIGHISQPFQVYIFGMMKTNMGILAVDDIRFVDCNFPTSSSCDSSQQQFTCASSACVPISTLCDYTDDCGDGSDEANCDRYQARTDFEESMGTWSGVAGQDTFHRDRYSNIRGSTMFNVPGRDHTKGLQSGYYAYVDRLTHSPGQKIWLVSSVFQPTTANTCTLRFYYHMYGTIVGSLNIYTRTTELGTPKRLVSLSGNYGDAWNRRDVTLHESANFQVVIEGVVNNAANGLIAIDDISMTPGCVPATVPLPSGSPPSPTILSTCPSSQFACDGARCISKSQVCNFVTDCNDRTDESNCGTCHFNNGTCGWYDGSTGVFLWKLQSARDSARTHGPSLDGQGSASGQYMLVQPGSGVMINPAWLVSPVFAGSGDSCRLTFSVHMSGIGAGSLMVRRWDTSTHGLYSGISLWQSTGSESNAWKNISVDIGAVNVSFEIEFESQPDASVGTYSVAIDDVAFLDCALPQVSTTAPTSKAISSKTTPSLRHTTPAPKPASTPTRATLHATSAAGGCTQCGDGTGCFLPTQLCDGNNNCLDGTDEAASYCKCGGAYAQCQNGGSCRIQAGVGVVCTCLSSFIGKHCETPKQAFTGSSSKKWAVPVGVVLALLVVAAIVVTLFVLYRKNKLSGINLRTPFARFSRRGGAATSMANPLYDHSSGEIDLQVRHAAPQMMIGTDGASSLDFGPDSSKSINNPLYSDA